MWGAVEQWFEHLGRRCSDLNMWVVKQWLEYLALDGAVFRIRWVRWNSG